MRKWLLLLGGLIVWAVHFFLLYGFGSVFPGDPLANKLSIVATIACLSANAGLLWLAATLRLSGKGDDLDRWIIDIGGIGAALSFLAVAWQMLPPVMV